MLHGATTENALGVFKLLLLNLRRKLMSRQFAFTDFPQLQRFGVGFDRLSNVLTAAHNTLQQGNYPPHNIIKHSDTKYSIELAVAGFVEAELQLEVKDQTVTVTGTKQPSETTIEYLHSGIGYRDFVRQFTLSDTITVKGAVLKNGILSIELEKQLPTPPETIKITTL